MDETNLETAWGDDGLDEATLSAIDEDWGSDADLEGDGEAPESHDEAEPDAQPDDADDTDEPEDGDPETEGQEAQTEGSEADQKPEAGHQRFKLKVRGTEREVGLEEMTELAQKGADYDGLRQDRDQLRADKPRLESYEAFLKEMADAGGITVEELMESTRVQAMISKARSEGTELSEAEALSRVREKTGKAQQPAEKPQEPTPEQKQQASIRRFLDLYPDVKGTDIPAEVWAEAEKAGDLVAPYQKWQAQQLREQRTQLEQNRKNRERSTGSRKTAGKSAADRAFDAAWYDGT